MSDLMLNGSAALSGRVVLPRVGVAHADLVLETGDVPSGAATLTTADGALSLRGVVQATRSGAWQNRAEVRFVAGAGGLATVLAPRFYANATLRVLLADLCRETGETLSPASDPATLGATADKWTRRAGKAADALGRMLDVLAPGAAWRILSDGTLWVGPETWANVEVPGDVMVEAPTAMSRVLATDLPYGLLAPGTTWDGHRVASVEHHVEVSTVRTLVHFEPDGAAPLAASDRARRALDALVRNAVRDLLHHGLYPGEVIAQHGDGTVDVAPYLPALPQLVSVPIRTGTPGQTLEVLAGARVLVAFEGGDPGAPVVVAWADTPGASTTLDGWRISAATHVTLVSHVVELGGTGGTPIVRVGDDVSRTPAMAAWMTDVEAKLAASGHPVTTPYASDVIAEPSSGSAITKSL